MLRISHGNGARLRITILITDARKKVPISKQVEVKPTNMFVDLWVGRTICPSLKCVMSRR